MFVAEIVRVLILSLLSCLAAERLQVDHFFTESAFSNKPVVSSLFMCEYASFLLPVRLLIENLREHAHVGVENMYTDTF